MKLLEPIQVGKMTLKNRIMFPPLTTGYEERDGSIGQRSLSFYERLAKGGVSYIVIGDVAPVRTASPTPKLYSEEQIPAFKKLADTLHQYDCKVALQLFHPEYDVPGVGKMIMDAGIARQNAAKAKAEGDEAKATEQNELAQKITKDAYAKLHHDMQHFVSEATHEQLAQIKDSIASCAHKAMLAGIDAIEVHGDRLLGSLCSKVLNHRCDEYGGSFENRTRYALEVVEAIKEAAPDLTIEYKLPIITVNQDGSFRGKGGLEADEGVAFAKLLEKAGVDMIQVAQANHTGNMGDTIPPMGDVPYNWTLPIARRVKDAVSIPVATVGRVVTVEAGEKILNDGDADMIGYGRSLLTDPDIALKVKRGECIRECLNCNKGCVDAIQNRQYISCVLNAENGNEATISIKPTNHPKKVVVIGGGIAGLEAARVAAIKGHTVTLFEKTHHLGGQINIAAMPPRKSEILRSVEYYQKILPTLNVDIHLNEEVKDFNHYDYAIIAIGAHNMEMPIPHDESHIVSSWDVLAGQEVQGDCVVIGGGLVGAETAEYLANKGHHVTIVEMMDKIASGESTTVLPLMMKDFAEHNVKQLVNTKVDHIENNIVYTENEQIKADTIINALGSKKNIFDESTIIIPFVNAGDCSGEKTADIASAIRSGYQAANNIE
ncbi:bilirubin reductase, long form [Erysipelatoclostridium sp. AM42-17]|uniref:bilirubin reductase, long form n=1 Tax=Erysipelatoclostridium sp. AM42-17 TaxID=2293102 RepID=UPI000E534044|nr:bilirubin reductase, long form [Erysipelatoclostridium sp. AM42-17]RHS93870.1 FAD-dependent oxidoreductase [Erysipelatoclostridium sp. AM42-17]